MRTENKVANYQKQLQTRIPPPVPAPTQHFHYITVNYVPPPVILIDELTGFLGTLWSRVIFQEYSKNCR
jgi:hypothetical protein